MVLESVRAVATAARAGFGGSCDGHRYYDRDESHSVDIVRCVGAPTEGYAIQSTISLHLHPNLLDGKDVRTELAAVADVKIEAMANVLSTAAFFVIKNNWLAAPGVVFPEILEGYDLPTSMEHVLWYPPFPWEQLSATMVSPDLTVHWLLGIPIYDSERRHLEHYGYFELEKLFDRKRVPFFDLTRQPVV
jgi:antitoxin YqcF